MKKKSTVSPEKQIEEFNNFMINKGIFHKREDGQVVMSEVSHQAYERAVTDFRAKI